MKWSNEEIDYLRINFPTKESKGCVDLHKNHTLSAIKAKANHLGIKSNNWSRWSKEEEELLKTSWATDSMEVLLSKFPKRNYNELMQRAQSLKVKSKINRKRIGNLEFLDVLNEKSCYWWGFIIADGHIARNGEISIRLDIKDKNHLEKLANYLNCKVTERKYRNSYTKTESHSCILRIGHRKFAEKWLNILNIHSPKTYTPPDLSIFLTENFLIYFLLGLIDGDGCIWLSKKWPNMKIELHHNWYNTLKILSEYLLKLYNINCKVFYSKRSTSNLVINTKKDLTILKEYIEKVNVLERKWNKLSNL